MSDELKGPPPPGPIQPIFNDSLTQVERERRMLRAKADAITSPEARENVVSAAAAFGKQFGKPQGLKKLPARSNPSSATAKPATLTAPTGTPFSKTTPKITPTKPMAKQTQNLIVPVNAQGNPVADTRPQPEQPKLTFSPAPDGSFVKVAKRPRPSNHPIGQPWTQMFVATHSNEIFAIVRDAHSAELVANALNVYFNALLQHQAEQQAAEGAAAAAANDSNVFDAGLPAGEVDAVTGAPIESVGQPSDIEQLPSL